MAMTTTPEDTPQLPEYRDNPFISVLPPVLNHMEVLKTLTQMPDYNPAERNFPHHLRSHCVLRLARYFDPSERHIKLELRISALLRQGYVARNPKNGQFVKRLQNAYERVAQNDSMAYRHQIATTASGFGLIGCSGIGKSVGMLRILKMYPQVVSHNEPFSLQQIVWLKLDCPYKGSPKQLCINFFSQVDRLLGTSYLGRHGQSRSGTDKMMIQMQRIADLHALGILVVDEIQHLRSAPGADASDLLNFLVTLVNVIGIPVILVGTLGALPVLQGDFRGARRASGLGSMVWERFDRGSTWNRFVDRMWKFQWTSEVTPLSDELRAALYEESQGIVDVLIKLFMLVQLHAIQLGALKNRREIIDVGLVRHVARENFKLIAPMIAALKQNDVERIAKYDDLRPLNDYFRQTIETMVGPLPAGSPIIASEPAYKDADSTPSDDALFEALAKFSVAPDIARKVLAEIRVENPDLAAFELLGEIVKRLALPATQSAAKKSGRGRQAGKSRTVVPIAGEDLRSIVAEGKQAGQAAYAALLKAGMIRPPKGNLVA